MHGFILLCDFAEAINGKLYIQGGGWSRMGIPPGAAPTITVAAMIYVPWADANRAHKLLIQLVDQDGHSLQLGNPPVAVEMRGDFEVGRPPGTAPGSDLEMPVVARFEGVPIPAGRYKFVLHAGTHTLGDVKFEIANAPAAQV